ncbi:MAG: Jag N-terminal domain-containing protein [Anaerolineae bacterium]|nr:Jag N-terminal domain-containing protein [Anaerolineae bacterium]
MKSEKWVEITAPTSDEAIILALARLGITREEAIIEMLDEGSPGFLGLGARDACVRVERRPAPSGEVAEPSPPAPVAPPVLEVAETPAPAPVPVAPLAPVAKKPVPRGGADWNPEQVEQVLTAVAEKMFAVLDVQIETEWRKEERPTLWLSLRGKDADMLVGPHGQTLNSVQYLVRAVVRRQVNGNFNLMVDADGYRERHIQSLVNLAHKMADRAAASGRTVRLRSMPARERRIIHITLRQDARVQTRSVGSGRRRIVTIIPNRDS